MKRLVDLIMSFSLIIVLSPLLIALLIKKQNIERLSLESTKIARYKKRGVLRFYLDLFNILLGKISFVGAPIIEKNVPTDRKYFYKPGLTGLVQINKLADLASIEKVEIIYLKNYSLALDMKIILKTLIK